MNQLAPTPGDSAPQLQLPTIDGDAFDLQHHRGKFVIVSFLRHAG